jgi:hypothetical protein
MQQVTAKAKTTTAITPQPAELKQEASSGPEFILAAETKHNQSNDRRMGPWQIIARKK